VAEKSGSEDAGTLIIGAGQTGLQVACSLRDLGDARKITLLGEEPHAPYSRPALSKELLTGEAEPESLSLRNKDWFIQSGIDLVLREQVVNLRLPDGEAPGCATTSAGRDLPFGRLALTVGAAPRRLDVPGAAVAGVCYLRDLNQAVELRRRLGGSRRVVVVGGGFIGLEAAAAARALGKDVTVVEVEDRLIPRAIGPAMSEFLRAAHQRRGTTVVLSTGVAAVDSSAGRVTGVFLRDGARLPADLVVVGVGVLPRIELAQQVGLACDGGIVVDRYARTSAAGVVAGGDCTVLPHPLTGQGMVRLESVQNAATQGALAAASLLERCDATPVVPWFWSTQGDLRLQIAGLASGFDREVLRGNPDTEHFSVLYYRGDQLLAVDAMNSPADYLVVRKALAQGVALSAELAADASTPLKALLSAAAAAAAAAAR
jgi:3-phenylpropionate/trans-cinnamate dioxygenase ferredoxin reductase subunit